MLYMYNVELKFSECCYEKRTIKEKNSLLGENSKLLNTFKTQEDMVLQDMMLSGNVHYKVVDGI